MTNAYLQVPQPVNEPVLAYRPGSRERTAIKAKLAELSSREIEIPLMIGGQPVKTGKLAEIRAPHDHSIKLGVYHQAGANEVNMALYCHLLWPVRPWEQRASVFLKAAELLSGPWRATLNAATMLGQSKTVHQAEIDSACEVIDFWRYNVYYMTRLMADQPISSPGVWNRVEYRPLEGFIFAVTPFNFTAIAANLPTAPARVGNVVVWKPASSAIYAAYHIYQLLVAAGLPAGVINFVAAVIDQGAYETITAYIDYAREDNECEIISGGNYDDSRGYFIEPTTLVTTNPRSKLMEEEIFGPVLTIFVYDDDKLDETLELCNTTSPFALTGAIFGRDRQMVTKMTDYLRDAAGNFYINDKPTGAVVGQQPFGGGRASGTNDKAGSMMNLLRWMTVRTIKENLAPPKEWKYPFMAAE